MSLNSKNISITVVVPVHNEQGNAAALASEINQAGKSCEIKKIVFVDDNSSDNTCAELDSIREEINTLVVLQHQAQSGQSAAIFTGVRYADTDWVVTMDGDGQNDPADIPKMIQALVDSDNENIKLVNGNRNIKNNRKDTVIKKWSSKIANKVRSAMLKDNIPDSGCGLKLMCRETYLSLPYFTNLHRFTPALFLRTGAEIMSVDVGHRQRSSGKSHYGLWNRLWIGIVDLLGVTWLMRKGYKAKLKE
jgi:dolichol-phosphate mannosyltransferase